MPRRVKQATSKQVPNDKESHAGIGADWKEAYGFQFWQCRHHAYRGDGADGREKLKQAIEQLVIHPKKN